MCWYRSWWSSVRWHPGRRPSQRCAGAYTPLLKDTAPPLHVCAPSTVQTAGRRPRRSPKCRAPRAFKAQHMRTAEAGIVNAPLAAIAACRVPLAAVCTTCVRHLSRPRLPRQGPRARDRFFYIGVRQSHRVLPARQSAWQPCRNHEAPCAAQPTGELVLPLERKRPRVRPTYPIRRLLRINAAPGPPTMTTCTVAATHTATWWLASGRRACSASERECANV